MTETTFRAIQQPHSSARERERAEANRESLREQNSKSQLDRRLDHALEETFPASDPIAVMIC